MFSHKVRMITLALVALIAIAPITGHADSIEFRAGTLIEAAFFKITPGHEKDVFEGYFPKVMPIAMEYGLRPLGTFSVNAVDHGSADSIGMWGFFEWPSVEKKEAFERDPRFAPLRAFRDSHLDTLPIQVYLRVAKTTVVELDPTKMYESASVWINAGRKSHLDTYFAAAGPFIVEHGVNFLVDFEVVGQSSNAENSFDEAPHAFLFIEWPSRSVKDQWFESETFQSVGWNRALALDRLFVIESSYMPAAGS